MMIKKQASDFFTRNRRVDIIVEDKVRKVQYWSGEDVEQGNLACREGLDDRDNDVSSIDNRHTGDDQRDTLFTAKFQQ